MANVVDASGLLVHGEEPQIVARMVIVPTPQHVGDDGKNGFRPPFPEELLLYD